MPTMELLNHYHYISYQHWHNYHHSQCIGKMSTGTWGNTGQNGKYLCKVASWSCEWKSLKLKVLNLVPCHHFHFLSLINEDVFKLTSRENINYKWLKTNCPSKMYDIRGTKLSWIFRTDTMYVNLHLITYTINLIRLC
jgi:hypothetical protein